jgi:hypothetical protein
MNARPWARVASVKTRWHGRPVSTSRGNGARCIRWREALEIMAMKNPPHVGSLIRREVIEPLGLTVTEAAKVLGVGRQAHSSPLNGKKLP